MTPVRPRVARALGICLPDFKGKDRLLRAILPPDGAAGFAFDVPYFSGRYLGDTAEFVDWTVWVHGGHERGAVAWLRDRAACADGPVFVDVGANTGTFTLALADVARHVHAVEPASANRSRLRRNLEASGARNVTVHEAALAEAPGTADLFRPESHENLGVASLDPDHNIENRLRETVKLDTLDAILADVPDQRPLIVKIDVEGSEGRVLAGGSSLSRRRCLLMIETVSKGVLDGLVRQGFTGRSLRLWYRRADFLPLSVATDLHVLSNTDAFGRLW